VQYHLPAFVPTQADGLLLVFVAKPNAAAQPRLKAGAQRTL